MSDRVYLSPPCMAGNEFKYVSEVFDQNWIAPVGPHLNKFEDAFIAELGGGHACALSSGTAAIHLSLILAGIEPGDEVMCSSFTFVASANPILQMGATPIFIDSDPTSWNLDPSLLGDFLKHRSDENRLPKALVLVHLYGQAADLDAISEICQRYDVALIEDAAEALGTRYKGRALGLDGLTGIYSFNGNKIITTSGGGMFVSNDEELVQQARFLSTQARDPAPHYEHTQAGFNYRMSNVLAAIGLGQMEVLGDFVAKTKEHFTKYSAAFAGVDAISMMPVPEWSDTTHWLSCITLDLAKTTATTEDVCRKLEDANIESRPLWKPMHLQPLFRSAEAVGGSVSEKLFHTGLCLPSGPNLTEEKHRQISQIIRNTVSSKNGG